MGQSLPVWPEPEYLPEQSLVIRVDKYMMMMMMMMMMIMMMDGVLVSVWSCACALLALSSVMGGL